MTIEQPAGVTAWPSAELTALADGIGGVRAAAAGLLPDADWEDEAARGFAERAAELLAGLAVAEGAARGLAGGVR
ncbi:MULTISPECIES: hypothetical protein [unclassified Rathayibacter]|uniref:hypothetical protein n=1 Tax=unclassified Rathayibacter TaxID=2609250 RepID=UPI0006F751DC|nr:MULTISPECIES: hypothetical protein [unclassified Rathayibacter]KQQ05706.1 hypothetical protein ASF42_03840 [Rathayibacter sp. Leaf294]KQS13564.1 hypothetical protein ASG06_03850 [Rathayibacter sp. Leaf185]